jgi:phage terminase small subunit
MKMTPKQQRFAEEYLIDLNATQAAIRAGYSAKRASEIAYQLLQKTTVQDAISEGQRRLSEKTGRDAKDVLRDIQQATKDAWAADDLRIVLKGLELEGRHLGMFTDKVSVNITDGLAERLDRAMKRHEMK